MISAGEHQGKLLISIGLANWQKVTRISQARWLI